MFPASQPNLKGNELKYVMDAISTGWISSKGSYIENLEKAFAEYVGTKYAVACSSGTTALHLAYSALRLDAGDEVIVPEFTMISTTLPLTYLGAKPVFVDCGDDLNIDVTKIRDAITPRTKAIVAVHIYGRPCDMDEIMKIAHEYNLYVVEDACEAHGANIGGKKVGSIGDIGCFSLFGNKIISAGEGGLITTNSDKIADQLRHLRTIAFDDDHSFLHPKVAYNFRLSNIQAAVGYAQLERIDEFLLKRKQIQGWYDAHLNKWSIPRPEGSVLWYYDIVTGSERQRDELMAHLKANGIETRRFFKPMTDQPIYKDTKELRARDFGRCGLYLPTYVDLIKENVDEICKKVLEIL